MCCPPLSHRSHGEPSPSIRNRVSSLTHLCEYVFPVEENRTMRISGPSRPILLAISLLTCLCLAPLGEAGEHVLESLEQEMTKLVQRIRPSVVSVVAYCISPECVPSHISRGTEHPTSSRSNTSPWQKNIGSGCILTEDGYIVTAENVIRDAQEFEVTLSDETNRIATLIGADPESNIAVLKVDGNGFVPAGLGDSNRINAGSFITIVGNSFGLSSAVSFGLVNGTREADDLIQLSAPGSPGNSGAVALNTRGDVIGIIVAAVSEPVALNIGTPGTGNQQIQHVDLRAQGASLAIPIKTVTRIAERLIDHGVYERGWLGTVIQDLTPIQADRFGVETGVLVVDVHQSSPAAEANILKGDVIVAFNGKTVSSGKDLFDQVQWARVGTVVPLTISRKGRTYDLVADIARRPADLNQGTAGKSALTELSADSSPAPSPPLIQKLFLFLCT